MHVTIKRGENKILSIYVQTKLKVKAVGIEYVIDPRLGNNYPKDIYNDVIKLAIDCASFNSEDRPSMKVKTINMWACLHQLDTHTIKNREICLDSSL
jgi:hypothetical protein